MNRLVASVAPPGDMKTMQRRVFRTFRAIGTAGRWFYTARRQALIFSTNFSGLRSFRKTAFLDSLTVRFR